MEKWNERSLRVCAADDSAVMRGILRTLFQRHGEDVRSELSKMELVAVARDGVECLEAVERLVPDVLVLDLEMPRLDGLGVLDRLRAAKSRLPVIMCSSHTERGAHATLDALARGAKDYVMKPAGQRSFEEALASLSQQLLPRIAAIAAGREDLSRLSARRPAPRTMLSEMKKGSADAASQIEVVVIGVSTGGPAALEHLLPRLSADLPVPVLIVQHMPKLFTGVLADRLDRCGSLRVEEAYHGVPLRPGRVLLAPGDAHMEVTPQVLSGWNREERVRGRVKLHFQEPLNYCRPSVDYLFRSAAQMYGSGVLALVLTGMGSDGLDGARAVCDRGGVVLAQDEASSAVWGMPGRVSQSGIASATLPLDALAHEVNQRVSVGRLVTPHPVLRSPEPTAERREVTHGLH
jgi:two-component system, chemotaxis family, protein-glutamate methylesterase/glutaminase